MTLIVASGVGVTAVPMGMDKKNDLPIKAETKKVKITGWTARSGYGDTVIAANSELVSTGLGVVVVRCRIEVSGKLGVDEQRVFELMRNEAPVATLGSATSPVIFPDTKLTLEKGDRVWVRMTGSDFGNFDSIIAGGSGTYLLFDLSA